MVDTIYLVILRDDEEMILIDCGYPNFSALTEECTIENNID